MRRRGDEFRVLLGLLPSMQIMQIPMLNLGTNRYTAMG